MSHPLFRVCIAVLLLANPAVAQQDDHGADHDHIEECPPFAWGHLIDPGEQTYSEEVVAGFDDGRIILEVRFDALKGPVAKHFMFLELIDGCVLRAVSVGSYMATALLADAEVVHVDLYEAADHMTLDLRDTVPEIADIREKALGIFLGTIEPEPLAGTSGQ